MASNALVQLAHKLYAAIEESEELAKASAREGFYSNALMHKQEANAYARAAEMAFTAINQEEEEDGTQRSCMTCQHFDEAPYTCGQGVCMAYERGVDEEPVWVYETEGSCTDWEEKK